MAGPGRPVAPRQTADHHVETVVAGLAVTPAGTVPSSVAGQVDARRRDAPDVDAAAGETGGEAGEVRRQEDVVPAHLLPAGWSGTGVQDPTLPTHQILRPAPAKVLLRKTDPATAPDGPDLEGPGRHQVPTADEATHPGLQVATVLVVPAAHRVPVVPTLLANEDAPVTVPVPQAVAGAAAVAGQVAAGPPRLAMAVQARAVAEERIGLTAAADGVATTAGPVGPTIVVLGGRPAIV